MSILTRIRSTPTWVRTVVVIGVSTAVAALIIFAGVRNHSEPLTHCNSLGTCVEAG